MDFDPSSDLSTEVSRYAFRNNRKLKRPGVKVEWTPEQALEVARCAVDPEYFIRKYVKIVDPNRGVVLFDLYDYQARFLDMIHVNRFVTARMARQMGKSTTVAAYICWYLIFNSSKQAMILANKASTAKEILTRVMLAYENIPIWLQMGVVSWNKGSFELENGSKCGHAATSSAAIRGMSIQFLLIDEVAHIPKNVWEDFYASVYPTVSAALESKIVMVSTPKGLNHFYDIHTKAMNGESAFKHIDVTWEQHPNRDEKWKEETIANTSVQKFAQEFECDFIGSSRTLILPGTLFSITAQKPIYEDEHLHLFEEPKKDHIYFMSVDPSLGTGNDYSAFQVFDITEFPFREVASYINNEISTTTFPDIIYEVATRFNKAYVLVELNNGGHEVANTLWIDLEYENLLSYKDTQDLTGQGKTKRGLWTSVKTKKIGCSKIKELVEKKRLIIKSNQTLKQLKFFVDQGDGKYAAEEGHHDDLVMCAVNFSFYVTTRLFKNSVYDGTKLIDMRTEFENDRENLISQTCLPMPIRTDGTTVAEKNPLLYGALLGTRRNSHGSTRSKVSALGELDELEKKSFLS